MKRIQKFNEGWKEDRKKQLQEELDKLNADPGKAPIIELEDYSDEDKIEYFNELYEMSRDYLARTQEGSTEDSDDEHWFFEKSIEVLNLNNPREVWKYINSL